MLDAYPDCATDTTIVEMGGILWRQVTEFVVVGDIAAIVLPGHAPFEIS
ncbi:hypothetical protein ACVIWV_009320 [Bradyrhizobium diazoefficiens]